MATRECFIVSMMAEIGFCYQKNILALGRKKSLPILWQFFVSASKLFHICNWVSQRRWTWFATLFSQICEQPVKIWCSSKHFPSQNLKSKKKYLHEMPKCQKFIIFPQRVYEMPVVGYFQSQFGIWSKTRWCFSPNGEEEVGGWIFLKKFPLPRKKREVPNENKHFFDVKTDGKVLRCKKRVLLFLAGKKFFLKKDFSVAGFLQSARCFLFCAAKYGKYQSIFQSLGTFLFFHGLLVFTSFFASHPFCP